jgi:hypothetical protein
VFSKMLEKRSQVPDEATKCSPGFSRNCLKKASEFARTERVRRVTTNDPGFS